MTEQIDSIDLVKPYIKDAMTHIERGRIYQAYACLSKALDCADRFNHYFVKPEPIPLKPRLEYGDGHDERTFTISNQDTGVTATGKTKEEAKELYEKLVKRHRKKDE